MSLSVLADSFSDGLGIPSCFAGGEFLGSVIVFAGVSESIRGRLSSGAAISGKQLYRKPLVIFRVYNRLPNYIPMV